MTLSIKTDGERVTVIYNGVKDGDGWVQIEQPRPKVEQANVQVTWYYDGTELYFETSPVPDDNVLE